MSNRKALTLEQKIALIRDNQNGHGLSVRQLADKYGISKSSAGNILQRREEFLSDYASNCNKGIKRKHKDENGQTIDELVFEWFTQQRAKQIPISRPVLQEKARQVAEQLGYSSDIFKASNGWLEKFRTRHAVSFRTICGESASIDDSTIEEWTNRLSTILDGFNAEDIFNADETGLFYSATPDRSLVLSKEECKGGKKSKERLTVLLCSNWNGTEKMKPVVIGRSQRPGCFKNITTSKLPVTWLANRTAWMTFKHIIAQCTLAQTADQISITVLDAIKWIDLSWENVTENTIKNGFRAAGFVRLSSTSSSSIMDVDIIAEGDMQSNNSDDPLQQLNSLLARLQVGTQQLTAVEFVDIDSCVPTFNEWDDNEHLKDLIQHTRDNNEEEDEEVPLAEQPPNLSEALEMMRKLHLFASIEQPQLHNLISDLESQLTDIYLDSKAIKQSSIKDYFSHF